MAIPSTKTCVGIARNRAAHTEIGLARHLPGWKTEEVRAAEQPQAERACRVPGCTNACIGACWWGYDGLCSAHRSYHETLWHD